MPKKRDTKSSANGENSQPRTKKMKVNDTVFDKPEEETIRDDFSQKLEGVLKAISLLIEGDLTKLGMSLGTGALYHGKPGLGLHALKYLEHHARDVAVVFPRHVVALTTQICEDTFKRAACCEPCIILLNGLEDASPDVAAVIAKEMKDVTDSCTLTSVLATTAMYGQVSEKLRGCFRVVDLKELTDSAGHD